MWERRLNAVDNTEFSCDAFSSNEESDYREGTWKATAAPVTRAWCIGPQQTHAEALFLYSDYVSTINSLYLNIRNLGPYTWNILL